MSTGCRRPRVRLVWLAVAALCLACESEHAHEDAKRAPAAVPQALAPSEPGTTRPILVVYVPPQLGQPRETIGAGVRSPAPAVRPVILAPDHVGLTSKPGPVLYWFLSEDVNREVEIKVSEDSVNSAPLLTLILSAPVAAGIHSVSLAKHGVELELGTPYRCVVSLIVDPESRVNDVVSKARIQRRAPSESVLEQLESAGSEEQAFVYAGNGFWYDAIAAASSGSGAAPGDRSALLVQVGLAEVAAYDGDTLPEDLGAF